MSSSEAPATDSREVTVMPLREVSVTGELSADDIVARLNKIEDVQRRAMNEGTDYGIIPGTGNRPTLLKAGAEKLCVLFRLDPQFETRKIEHQDGHVTIESTCIVYHQVSGQRLGSATAECSSRESKYAWRQGQRLCPKCHKPAIIKPKAKEGRTQTWWCATFAGKDGCGKNFDLDDPAITTQVVGRIINPDLPDTFPTVRRMAEKRALVAATRLVTGASAIFDEEMPEKEAAGDEGQAPDPKPDNASVKSDDPDAPCSKARFEAMIANGDRLMGAGATRSWAAERLAKYGIKRGASKASDIKNRHIAELESVLAEMERHLPEPPANGMSDEEFAAQFDEAQEAKV